MADTEQFAPKIMIAPHTPGAESRTRLSGNYREGKRNGSSSVVGAFVAFARRSKLMIGSFFLLVFVILFWFAIVERNGIHGPGVVPLSIWDVAVLVGANLVGSLFVFLIVFGFLQYLKDTHREEVLVRTVVEPLTEVFHKGQETLCV